MDEEAGSRKNAPGVGQRDLPGLQGRGAADAARRGAPIERREAETKPSDPVAYEALLRRFLRLRATSAGSSPELSSIKDPGSGTAERGEV